MKTCLAFISWKSLFLTLKINLLVDIELNKKPALSGFLFVTLALWEFVMFLFTLAFPFRLKENQLYHITCYLPANYADK